MRLQSLYAVAAAVLLASGPAPVEARPGHQRGRPGQLTCDLSSCSVATALERACPCTDAGAPGKYVRCAARTLKRLVVGGVIGRRCRARIFGVVTRSVCGRANAVVCLLPTSTCNPEGACANNSDVECLDDTDCGTRCAVTSWDQCASVSGMPLDVGSCVFASCASPSGAFVDAVPAS
jgi:hypothetical protein